MSNIFSNLEPIIHLDCNDFDHKTEIKLELTKSEQLEPIKSEQLESTKLIKYEDNFTKSSDIGLWELLSSKNDELNNLKDENSKQKIVIDSLKNTLHSKNNLIHELQSKIQVLEKTVCNVIGFPLITNVLNKAKRKQREVEEFVEKEKKKRAKK